jgi:cytoskeleton protein RodZ
MGSQGNRGCGEKSWEHIVDMETFGLLAKRQRESRGMTLEQVSSTTKIAVRYLRAIELEDLAYLPGGIITRGFIRAYATCIGFDDAHALHTFLASSEANNDYLTATPARVNLFTRCCYGVMRLPLWGLASVFVAIGLVLMTLGNELRDSYESVREPSLRQALPSDPSPAASERDEGKVARPLRLATRQEGSRHTINPVEQQKTAAAPASGPSTSQTFTVSIKARQDAWISIRADGRLICSETLIAPNEKLVEARDYIVVRAGNIGAVDFSFNGKNLPPQGGYDEARTINFDADGLQVRTADTNSPWSPTQIPMAQVSIEH